MEYFVGDKVGRWNIIEEVDPPPNIKNKNDKFYKCRCDCEKHTESIIPKSRLMAGRSKSCGCIRKENHLNKYSSELLNKRFGMLFVDSFAYTKNMRCYWNCKCDCGNETIVTSSSLINGSTKSCGCYRSDVTIYNNKILKHKFNTYDLSGEYGIGYTSKGEEFYFDLDDYELIKDYCWHLNSKGYVCTNINKEYITMHRFILGYGFVNDNDVIIDHIFHNIIDNRKENLRVTNNINNCRNHILSKRNKTGISGVCFKDDVFIAYIGVEYKTINLGSYYIFHDAVKARKEAEEKYFGEYSYDNSIKLKEINNGI